MVKMVPTKWSYAMTESEFRTNIPLLSNHFNNALVLDKTNFKIANFYPVPENPETGTSH